MELFELLAKLTLDATEYEKALKEAESKGGSVEDIEAHLDLDKDDFDEGIEEANSAEVDDPDEPELGLDDKPFHDAVSDAEDTVVDDPDEPELDLDTKPYNDALDQSQADTETWGSAIGDVFDGLKGLLAAAGITVAISSIVSNLSEAVDLARSMGDNIDKSSRAMSLSTDAYQEWSHVLDINGASITDLNRGLMNMRKLMGGGEPSKEFSAAMEQLGLSAKVANGEIKSTEDLLDASLKALADFEGSAEDRDVLAQALFGRGGTKLNAMFDGTSQDIEALKKQAHDLGLVMSEESVANAAAYNDAVTNMNASIESFRVAIVESILPALTDVFNKVAAIVAFFNPRNAKNGLSDQFKDIDEELAENLIDIEATSGAAEKMIDKLFSMGDATKLTAEQQAEWKATAQWLKDNIPSLSEVIDTDTLSISANKDQVIELTKEWKNYAIERAKADALKEKQEALAKKTTEWLEAEAEAVKAEGEQEKARAKMFEYAKRDFENMPADKQAQLASTLGYESPAALTASEKGLQGISNYLGPNYTELGWSSYGSRELNQAISDYDSSMGSAAVATSEARKKADELKTEVEEGQQELADYSATLDEVVGNLIGTGDEAEGASSDVEALNSSLENLPKSKVINIDVWTRWMNGEFPFAMPKAKGDWNVPYDNMPALLHRGERVLTASQARQMDSGYGSNMDFSGMYDIVERAIRAGMSGVSVNSFLSGKDVTDDVNRNTGRQLKARRFRG